MAAPALTSDFVAAMADEYHALRSLAERAAAQVDDGQFFATLDSEANSIAALMKHIGGNLNSRWRDFRTTDGEKPDRHRDAEFEPGESRDAVAAIWARGWEVLDGALGALTPADLAGHVVIRGERKSEREEKNGYREVRYGKFERRFTVPKGIDAEKAEARYDNGVLALTLPLPDAPKPKRIAVATSPAEEKKVA